jgi:hypothetical protein
MGEKVGEKGEESKASKKREAPEGWEEGEATRSVALRWHGRWDRGMRGEREERP